MLLYMSQPIHFSSSSLHYSYTAWTACISPHILKHIPLQYYAFINISLSHYNTTCMTWLWCDDLISYTFPLEWRIWLLPFPHNTSHFAPVLRFPALCFDIIRCSHGLRTPRERIFKNSKLLGLCRQIEPKILGAFGIFSAKIQHLSWHCESLVHGFE